MASHPVPTPYISLVLPAYNEERRLPATLQKLTQFCRASSVPFEVIVVDDGSTDRTRDIVKEMMKENAFIRLIQNPHSGKAFTVRTGALNAKGKYVLHVDADLSADTAQLLKLIEYLEQGNDIALGSRSGRPGAPWYRKLMSACWHTFVSTLLLPGVKDTQCGFKGYKTEIIQRIYTYTLLYNRPEQSLHSPRVTAAADVEVLFIGRKLGYRIAEVPIIWNYKEDTKISPLSDSLLAFLDLLRIYRFYINGKYAFPTGGSR